MMYDITLRVVFPYFIAVIRLLLLNIFCLLNSQLKVFGIGQIVNLFTNTLFLYTLNYDKLNKWCAYFKVKSIWMFPFIILFILCIISIICTEIAKSTKR